MKVLLQSRNNFLKSVAGDSIQIIKTAEYLNKLGVQAEISPAADLSLKDFDLVHLFNLMPVEETYRQFRNAKRQKKKILLSTIYWDPTEFLNASGQNDSFGPWWERTMSFRREVLAGASLILPNSIMELNILKKDFLELPPALIIPNAADHFFSDAKPDRFFQRFGMKDFLLSAGRICRRKNQLMLIRAARELNLSLVLIGPVNDGPYYRECRREAAGPTRISFIDALTPLELASAYAAARVHALVSWYETPGLASLEAALAGCRIVTTNRGSAVEYFGEAAFYCDPGSLASICEAIEKAWNSDHQSNLKERILQDYTWETAAMKTLKAYQTALSGSASRDPV